MRCSGYITHIPEIMYQYAQRAQKGLTATKKIKKFVGYLPTYKIFFFLRLTTYRYCTVGSDPVKNARTGSLIGPETMIYKLNILYRYYDNCRLSISHTALNFYLTSLKVRKKLQTVP